MSVPREVMKFMRTHVGSWTTYVSWIDKGPIVRTWGYHETKKHGFEYTEVMRETLEGIQIKNIDLVGMAGYVVIYDAERQGYYGTINNWMEHHNKPLGIYTKIINLQTIFEDKRFKYCAYKERFGNLMEYLKLYVEHPEIELMAKLNIKPSKMLIKKCQDKQFCRFLFEHKEDFEKSIYTPTEITYAYKNHMSLREAAHKLFDKRWAEKSTKDWPNIKTKGLDRVKIANFAYKQGFASYRDYWRAINYLGYDILDTKNIYPKEFDRMHDLRIDEYHSKKDQEDAKKKKQLSNQIKKVAEKYKPALIEDEKFCVIFPEKVMDFKREGNRLHHCVGKMGYDKKMAEERSLIAFIRKKKKKDIPFVTAEIKLNGTPALVQLYGDHDTKPKEEVRIFAEQFTKEIINQVKERRKHEKVNN